MERSRAKEIIKYFDIIKEYANGADIEYYDPISEKWLHCVPSFRHEYQYRVKPVRYRDLTTLEVCELMINKIAIYVVPDNDQVYANSDSQMYYIDSLSNGEAKIYNSRTGERTRACFADLRKYFVYDDHTPVAKEVT